MRNNVSGNTKVRQTPIGEPMLPMRPTLESKPNYTTSVAQVASSYLLTLAKRMDFSDLPSIEQVKE